MTRSLLVVGTDLDPRVADRLAARGVELERRASVTPSDLRGRPPRAALVEWELEAGSGPGLCARLKRDAALSAVWVVLCSDHGEALKEHAQTSATPADAYLERPFSLDSLHRALAPSGLLDAELDAEPGAPEPAPEPAPPEPHDAASATEEAGADEVPRVTDARARLQALSLASEASPPHRASLEERLGWLRQHARDLETKNQTLAALASEVLDEREQAAGAVARARARGTELEAALEAERAETERVRRAFQSYEAEVHRVVQAKQGEERAAAEALRGARERIAALEQAADDDARRRSILEGELERLDEATRAERRANEALRQRLDESQGRIAQLEARVEAADGLVDEMQNEVEALRARERGDAEAEARAEDLRARLRRWADAVAELERALSAGL